MKKNQAYSMMTDLTQTIFNTNFSYIIRLE